MPAPLSTSSCPSMETLSSSLTPPISAARTETDRTSAVQRPTTFEIISCLLSGNRVAICPRASRPESKQIGVGRGAPERATGMYTKVHEDRERGATTAGVDMRRLYGLEDTGCTHPGAYAHRHHPVL